MARQRQTTKTRTKATAGTKPRSQYVDVPLYQALITSCFLTALVATLALSFNWPYQVPLLTLGFSLFAAWLWRLGLWDRLLFVAEIITSSDINQNGQIGHLVVKNVSRAKATTAKTITERANEDKIKGLQDFVERAFSIGTSESAMGIKPSARAGYLENRDVLMRLGLAQWRNPQNTKAGWVMTSDKDTTYTTIQNHVVDSG